MVLSRFSKRAEKISSMFLSSPGVWDGLSSGLAAPGGEALLFLGGEEIGMGPGGELGLFLVELIFFPLFFFFLNLLGAALPPGVLDLTFPGLVLAVWELKPVTWGGEAWEIGP